ncbi:hypothetical protein [Gloeobacter violaceus]|uniref:hypothetical protein n=1 Tax=Gloeobacter violaceus TaxID=33072 RepID=UPI0013E8E401|nr:hypothetical protein [Gloeobacter violaceus]
MAPELWELLQMFDHRNSQDKADRDVVIAEGIDQAARGKKTRDPKPERLFAQAGADSH